MAFVGLVDLKSLRVTLDDTGDDDIDKFEVRDDWGVGRGEVYGVAEARVSDDCWLKKCSPTTMFMKPKFST